MPASPPARTLVTCHDHTFADSSSLVGSRWPSASGLVPRCPRRRRREPTGLQQRTAREDRGAPSSARRRSTTRSPRWTAGSRAIDSELARLGDQIGAVRQSSPSRARSSTCCSEQLARKRQELRRAQAKLVLEQRQLRAARGHRVQDRRPQLRRRRALAPPASRTSSAASASCAASSAATTSWSAGSRRRATRWPARSAPWPTKERGVQQGGRRPAGAERPAGGAAGFAGGAEAGRRWPCASRRTASSRASERPGRSSSSRRTSCSPRATRSSGVIAGAQGSGGGTGSLMWPVSAPSRRRSAGASTRSCTTASSTPASTSRGATACPSTPPTAARSSTPAGWAGTAT